MKAKFLACILFLVSCNDMFTDDDKKVTNKIYLTHVGGGEGYTLSFNFGKSLFTPIVDENIVELKGNKDTLFVKSSSKTDTNYYYVVHNNGDYILSTKHIDASQYYMKTNNRKFQYMFNNKK
jgi:hypothetical protein